MQVRQAEESPRPPVNTASPSSTNPLTQDPTKVDGREEAGTAQARHPLDGARRQNKNRFYAKRKTRQSGKISGSAQRPKQEEEL